MFWKKLLQLRRKRGSSRPQAVVDIRAGYRVSPSLEAPILLIVDRHPIPARDISSGGVSFKNRNFMVGVFYSVNFILPHDKKEISGQLEIMSIDRDKVCRCRFLDLTQEQEDTIHQYVMERKKEILAESQNRSAVYH